MHFSEAASFTSVTIAVACVLVFILWRRRTHLRPVRPHEYVLITGGSTGIGRYTSLYLVDKVGYHVIATVRRSEDGAALLENAKHKERLHIVLMDVTKSDDIQHAVESTERILGTEGRLVGVFNNAGGNPNACLSIEDTTMATYASIMAVNFLGVVAVSKAFLPLLRKSKGTIINNSSVAGRLSLPLMQPYSASKAAVESFSDSLRREVSKFSVRVVIIEPGLIWSEANNKHLQTMPTPDMYSHELYPETVPYNINNFNSGQKQAQSPLIIAESVERAIRCRHPSARYHGGGHATAGILTSMLPTVAQDLALRVMWLASTRHAQLQSRLDSSTRPDRLFCF